MFFSKEWLNRAQITLSTYCKFFFFLFFSRTVSVLAHAKVKPDIFYFHILDNLYLIMRKTWNKYQQHAKLFIHLNYMSAIFFFTHTKLSLSFDLCNSRNRRKIYLTQACQLLLILIFSLKIMVGQSYSLRLVKYIIFIIYK